MNLDARHFPGFFAEADKLPPPSPAQLIEAKRAIEEAVRRGVLSITRPDYKP